MIYTVNLRSSYPFYILTYVLYKWVPNSWADGKPLKGYLVTSLRDTPFLIAAIQYTYHWYVYPSSYCIYICISHSVSVCRSAGLLSPLSSTSLQWTVCSCLNNILLPFIKYIFSTFWYLNALRSVFETENLFNHFFKFLFLSFLSFLFHFRFSVGLFLAAIHLFHSISSLSLTLFIFFAFNVITIVLPSGPVGITIVWHNQCFVFLNLPSDPLFRIC